MSGKLTVEQVRECVQHVYYEGYNDGSVHRGHGIEEVDWHAIADELNAALGGGECEMHRYNNVLGPIDEWQCSECEADVKGLADDTPPNYCPNCGRKVSA